MSRRIAAGGWPTQNSRPQRPVLSDKNTEKRIPADLSPRTKASGAVQEPTQRRAPSNTQELFQKLPNEPLKRGYPTFFFSLSSHSLIPANCSISASWCSHHRRSYVFQCIPFGFSGNGFIMLALPPSLSRIDCALCRARYIEFSLWLS